VFESGAPNHGVRRVPVAGIVKLVIHVEPGAAEPFDADAAAAKDRLLSARLSDAVRRRDEAAGRVQLHKTQLAQAEARKAAAAAQVEALCAELRAALAAGSDGEGLAARRLGTAPRGAALAELCGSVAGMLSAAEGAVTGATRTAAEAAAELQAHRRATRRAEALAGLLKVAAPFLSALAEVGD
jgi:hypothetical protein